MEIRKKLRLENFDYSSNGYYFITICTAKKQKILCNIVGANCVRPIEIKYTQTGKIIKDNVLILNTVYSNVKVDKYVIMPNHIHLILSITNDGRTQFAPTVSQIIKQFKGKVTKQLGFSPWQKSFYDHIIRDENDYLKIWNYIDTNPQKWAEDKYYIR